MLGMRCQQVLPLLALQMRVLIKLYRGTSEGVRGSTNSAAPGPAVQFHVRSPSPCRYLSPVGPPRPSPGPPSRALSPSRSRSRSHPPNISLPRGWVKQKTPEEETFHSNHTRREITRTPPPHRTPPCVGTALNLRVGRQNHCPVQTPKSVYK